MGIVLERAAPMITFLVLGEEDEMVFPPFFCSILLCFEARESAEEDFLISLREVQVMVEDRGEDRG